MAWLGHPLLKNPEFNPDRDLEKFPFTFNPMGYLRRAEGSGRSAG